MTNVSKIDPPHPFTKTNNVCYFLLCLTDHIFFNQGHAHALQQSPGFSSGVEWNDRTKEFAQSSVHIDHQMGRSSHQFQSAGTSFSQGSEESCLVPSHPVLAPYSSSTQPKHHFPSANLMSEHHNSYSFKSDPDGRVHYEEHKREHAGNVSLSSQQISWDSGGSAPSGVAYVQDGVLLFVFSNVYKLCSYS